MTREPFSGDVVNNGHFTFRVIASVDGWAWVRNITSPAREKEGPLTFRLADLSPGRAADA